jgi:DNA primase
MTSWIEFETIKRAVPIVVVLEYYQIGELRRSGPHQLRGRCPLHSGEGRDTFHANTAAQVFHCFSCGAGGSVLDLVAAIERCGLREAARKLLSWRDSVRVIDTRPSRCGSSSPRKPTVTKKRESVPVLGFHLRGVDGRHPYLSSRGISEATAATFGVGFYSGPGLMSQRLVIPIEDETGRLVGYCGRSLDGSEPRYKFPPGFAKSQLLFNLHRAAATRPPTVMVVEGFFDCLKVYQAGFHAVVALMGAALYECQQWLLVQRFRHVILMLDGDAAGRRASAMAASRLSASCSLRIIELADNTQPDQLSDQSLRELLSEKGD